MYTSKMNRGIKSGGAHPPESTTRFAIVGNPRTGSSHLGSLLDSHRDIAFWDGEILDVGEEFDRSGYDRPADFLTAHVFQVTAKAIGFKLLWDALDRFPDIWTTLEELDIRLLHTVRENRLDSFISLRLATINDSFTCWYGPWKSMTFVADYDEALEWFERTESNDTRIRVLAAQHARPRLELEYQSLCITPRLALDFLHLPQMKLTSAYTKQRTNSQAEAIENYEELRARFASTPWVRYFTDTDL